MRPLAFAALGMLLALSSCLDTTSPDAGATVRLAPRLRAQAPPPPAQRVRLALLVDGVLRDTLDLPYRSGQELSFPSVPAGATFDLVLVGYDTFTDGAAARWGTGAHGTAQSGGVQTVDLNLQVPARPVLAFSGTTTIDSLLSGDSLWAADASHPSRIPPSARYRLGPGSRLPVSGLLAFARTETATFLPSALATPWRAFATLWSDTVRFTVSDPTGLAVRGSFQDPRDGRTYQTLTWLGTTWMAENLAWSGPGDSLGLCPANQPDSCARYGRLYTWSQAMAGSAPSTTYPGAARGACPTGWHLPSPAEWDTLGALLGGRLVAGDSLRASADWPGRPAARDAIGFAALAAGQGYAADTTFAGRGTDAWWWTSERITSSEATRYSIAVGYADLFSSTGTTTGPYAQMFSIRCVRNHP